MPSIQDYMSLDLVIVLITSNKQIFTEICLINAMGKEWEGKGRGRGREGEGKGRAGEGKGREGEGKGRGGEERYLQGNTLK